MNAVTAPAGGVLRPLAMTGVRREETAAGGGDGDTVFDTLYRLRAEEIEFEVGLSTNYLVVQMQRALTAARELELRAVLDYQRALIEFDRAQRASRPGAGVAVVVGGP